MRFGPEVCFLCGTTIAAGQQIPVFPHWLQQKYNLATQNLKLLDQSIISYGELVIPTCESCAAHINEVETIVEEKAGKGLSGWQEIAPETLFKWFGKLFYGILITELKNELNPLIKPEHAVGENPKMMHKFQSFYQLLQSIWVPIVFDDFTPASFFIMPVNAPQNTFSYRDELTTMMFSLQVDDVLVVCNLLDNGILKKALTPVWKEVEGKKLHPVQAAEMEARIYYAAYLFNPIPDYFARPIKPADTEIIYDTLIDDITDAIFNPWENSAYVTVLENFWSPWQLSLQQILANPAKPLSFLLDDEGNFRTFEPEMLAHS